MIDSRLALENFKPESWELKPFDLTKINNIVNIHPFQYIMINLYGDYPFFDEEGRFMNEYGETMDDEGKIRDEYGEIMYENPDEGELVFGFKYFEFLDNYYRYGIGFDPNFNLQDENKLYIKCFYSKGGRSDITDKDKYYILDKKRWKLDLVPFNDAKKWHLKLLLFNDVKVIKLEDIDEGKKELTEIEKWKRKVVCRQKSLKNKLTLLNPEVYNNFLLFYKLSKKDKMSHGMIDYYLSFDGIEFLSNKKYNNTYKNNYKDIKIYEDRLFDKYKELFN